MSKKTITVVLFIACLAAIVGCVIVSGGKDKIGPEIKIPAETITYSENMDEKDLLKGVSAVDEKDGDVSDSLMVEKVMISSDGKSVQIVYAAMDKSNNVAKEYRTAKYKSEEDEDTRDEEVVNTPVTTTPVPTATPEPTVVPTTTPEVQPSPTPVEETYSGDSEGVLKATIGTELRLIEPSRVRKAPTVESDVIISLEQGAVVLKQGTSGQWVKVSVDGVFGYVRSDLMVLN